MAVNMNFHQIELVNYGDDPIFDEAIKFFRTNILNELNEIGVNCWVAGGSVREYFLNKSVNCDFDLYFPTVEMFNRAKMHYTDRQTAKSLFDYFRSTVEVEQAKVLYETENSCKISYQGKNIDLVKNPRIDLENTIRRFDFTVCSAGISYNQVIMWPKYFHHLINKKLVIKNFHDPVSTLQRVARYIAKGYTIDNSELIELARQIKKSNISENYMTDFFESVENPNGTVRVGKNGFLKPEVLTPLDPTDSTGYGAPSASTAGNASTSGYYY